MRVMHVIDSLALGGAERMLVTLANRSHAGGLGVSVCATRAAGQLARELRNGIPLRVLPRNSRIDTNAFASLSDWATNLRTDLFHVHGRSSFSFLAAAKTAGAVSAPIVFHDHYGAIERDPAVPAWMRCWGAALVSQYVGVSDRLSEWAGRARVPRTRIRVIENGIEIGPYLAPRRPGIPSAPDVGSNTHTGIVVANVRADKGIDVLIRALTRVAGWRQPRILICGAISDTEYKVHCESLLEAAGLRERVRFLGERGDIPQLIAEADFGVISAVSESGPLVLAEFMAGGLPFVSTEAGSLAQRAASLGAREFVPAGDERSLANALERLLGLSGEELKTRGEKGRSLASRHFDIAIQMPRWYGVYEDALRKGRT